MACYLKGRFLPFYERHLKIITREINELKNTQKCGKEGLSLAKLHFRDGLVWTVGLAVEIKLYFQISPA